MKKEHYKSYGIVFIALQIAMGISAMIAFFVPFISFDVLVAQIDINGIDFWKIAVGWTSAQELWGETQTVMEWLIGFVLAVNAFICLWSPVVWIFSTLKTEIKYICSDKIGKEARKSVSFFALLVYWALASISCIAFGGNTSLHIPFFFSLICYIAVHVVYNHRQKAIAGNVKPFCLWSDTDSESNKNNDDAELLYKYKELLDNGIITEQEFQQKKEEILGGKRKNG